MRIADVSNAAYHRGKSDAYGVVSKVVTDNRLRDILIEKARKHTAVAERRLIDADSAAYHRGIADVYDVVNKVVTDKRLRDILIGKARKHKAIADRLKYTAQVGEVSSQPE
jgi:hypothetical protein